MLDRALFALGFGLGLPSFLWAAGATLPPDRLGAWGVVGFVMGFALPTGLDWLFQWAKADEISIIKQRDANSEMTLAHAAEVRARLELPAEVESDDADTDLQRARALALDRFFRAGDAAGGFSIRKLDGIVGSDTWGQLVHFYGRTAGGNVLRDAGGDVGYTWGHGWSLDRVTMALHAGRLPCPDMPVPVVQVFVANTTRQRAQRQRATGQTIDGEVVKA